MENTELTPGDWLKLEYFMREQVRQNVAERNLAERLGTADVSGIAYGLTEERVR